MNVKSLIMNTNFEEVMRVISIHYGSLEETQQRDLYEKLKQMEAVPNVEHLTIYVNAFLCSENEEDEEVCLTEFDEYDAGLCFDVSAFDDNSEYAYSIAGSRYKDLLGYEISDETRKLFTDASILAHVLWEVTGYTYDHFD